MTKIDSDLRAFCKAMLYAIESEETPPHWFISRAGLCMNAVMFDDRNGSMVRAQLAVMFDNKHLPFNNNNPAEYYSEKCSDKIYENKERIAFLKKYA